MRRRGSRAQRTADPELRPIVCLSLPNTRQSERRTRFDPSRSRDPRRRERMLWQHGVMAITCDVHRGLLNPFFRYGQFYAGFDVVRALGILLFWRRADVVIAQYASTGLFLVLLRRLFFFRPKIVLSDVSAPGWKIRDLVQNAVIAHVDAIITLTEHSRENVALTNDPTAPLAVVSAGVDEEFYAPDDREPSIDVLAVGEDFSRDFATLIAACRDLPCSLVLKTKMPVTIPADMKDRVRIIRERLSDAGLRALYAQARIVCLPLVPSANAGGISTLLEAMAMGKPIVASDHGTVLDHLDGEREGIVVASEDPQAMRAAIKRLLGDPGLGAKLGTEARLRVMRDFSMPAWSAKFAACLRRAAGAPPWPTVR